MDSYAQVLQHTPRNSYSRLWAKVIALAIKEKDYAYLMSDLFVLHTKMAGIDTAKIQQLFSPSTRPSLPDK